VAVIVDELDVVSDSSVVLDASGKRLILLDR
jgi:hypothetical protein